MSEFGSGPTKVLPTRNPPGTTEQITPEFAAGEVGQVTHTRYIVGPAGEDGTGSTPESSTLGYDGDGKLITITKLSGITTLTYDVEDKLSTVVKPDHTKTLAYDGDDRLVTITVS